MDLIVSHFINEWGTFGVFLICVIYFIYDKWKNNDSIKKKFDIVADALTNRINILEEKILDIPMRHAEYINKLQDNHKNEHSKMMIDLMRLGPNLHDTLKDSNDKINGDHIFIGSFHNGNSSITGIPYYKFDIIAERFKKNAIARDCEFAHMYKDSDILRFDKIPMLLIQEHMLHFTVPAEGEPEMANVDDIIWRRMRGRGIRQIALHVLLDKSGIPSGFVGVIKYDFDDMNLFELKLCAKKLEDEYHKAENKKD